MAESITPAGMMMSGGDGLFGGSGLIGGLILGSLLRNNGNLFGNDGGAAAAAALAAASASRIGNRTPGNLPEALVKLVKPSITTPVTALSALMLSAPPTVDALKSILPG